MVIESCGEVGINRWYKSSNVTARCSCKYEQKYNKKDPKRELLKN